MGLKELFFALEDKWYAALEWIASKGIPVFAIVDPIDKIIPSFLLFTIATAAVAGGAVYTAAGGQISIPWLEAPKAEPFTFAVEDVNGTGLEGAALWLLNAEGKEEFSEYTNAFGEVLILDFKGRYKAVVEMGGFEKAEKFVILAPGGKETVTLKALEKDQPPPGVAFKTLSLKDQEGATLSVPVSLNFVCAGSIDTPSAMLVTVPEVKVEVPQNCGTLTVTAKADGYEDTPAIVTGDTGTIKMKKKAPPKAKIIVNVLKEDGTRLKNIQIRLFEEKDALVDQEMSDESGTATFEVIPGIYSAQAYDTSGTYATASSPKQLVEAGKELNLTLRLSVVDQRKKIYIKAQDASTKETVAAANVTLFINIYETTFATTDAAGEATFNVDGNSADENATAAYAMFITHPTHVSKLIPSIKPVLVGSTTPEIVEMPTATQQNSGTIAVSVKDEQQKFVEAAQVYLLNSAHKYTLATLPSSKTEPSLFNNMPAANYYAYATKGEEKGESEKKDLTAGQRLDLNISMVLGFGQIEAIVKDPAGLAVQGATVEFIDTIDKNILATATTNASGSTGPQTFKSNKTVSMNVSKDGFVTTATKPYAMQINTAQKVNVKLYQTAALSSLDIELTDILQADGKTLATRLERGKSYVLKFLVKVPPEDTSDTTAIVRTGLQSQLNTAQTDTVIRSVTVTEGVPLLMGCYNPADNYTSCEPVQADAKQAVIPLGSLGFGVHEFVANIFIKDVPSLVENVSPIEIRYGVKAKQGAVETLKPSQSELYLRSYVLGKIICTTNCPGFVYDLKLQKPDNTIVALGTTPEKLENETEYTLLYTIFNTSKRTLTNTVLSFSNDNAAIALSSTSESIGTFEKDTSYSGSVKFTTKREASSTKIILSLNQQVSSNTKDALFTIPAGKRLTVALSPASLFANVPNTMTVTVTDTETAAKLSGAQVDVYKKEGDTNVLFICCRPTDAQGAAVIDVPPLSQGSVLTVFAKQTGYSKNFQEITVSNPPPPPPPSTETNFSCLSVTPTQLQFDRSKAPATGSSYAIGSITIQATNCTTTFKVYAVSNQNAGLTVVSTSTNLSQTNSVNKAVTGTITTALGEAPLYTYAEPCTVSATGGTTCDGTKKRLIGTTVVTTSDPNACLNMTSPPAPFFDLSGGPRSGRVFNSCFGADSGSATLPSVTNNTNTKVSVQMTTLPAPNHQGNIDFKVSNVSLQGEDYTTFKVNDQKGTNNLGPTYSDPVTIEYTIVATGDNSITNPCPPVTGFEGVTTPRSQCLPPNVPPSTYCTKTMAEKIVDLSDPKALTRFGFKISNTATTKCAADKPLCFAIRTQTKQVTANSKCSLDDQSAATQSDPATNPPTPDIFSTASPPQKVVTGIKIAVYPVGSSSYYGKYTLITKKLNTNCALGAADPTTTLYSPSISSTVKTNLDSQLNSTSYGGFLTAAAGYAIVGIKIGYPSTYTYRQVQSLVVDNKQLKITSDCVPTQQPSTCTKDINFSMNANDQFFDAGGIPPCTPPGSTKIVKYDLSVKTVYKRNATTGKYDAVTSQYVTDKKFKNTGSTTTTDATDRIMLKSLKAGTSAYSWSNITENFSAKVKLAELAPACVGPNNVIGKTGATVAPKVLLGWSWDDVQMNSCDFGNANGFYCDATQLTMAIVRRLEDAKNRQSEVPLVFNANLVKDGYSEDMQKDFDNYMKTQAFFAVPSFYTDSQQGWQLYLQDPQKFWYSDMPGTVRTGVVPIPSPGKYSVQIIKQLPATEPWTFFKNGQPNGKIIVVLQKLLDVPSAEDSPFYYLPFDGEIGLEGTQAVLNRTGYGVAYVAGSDVIPLSSKIDPTAAISTLPSTGSTGNVTNVAVVKVADFATLNNTKRSQLAVVSKNSITYSPTHGTPVALTAESKSQKAAGFFTLKKGALAFNEPVSINTWNGIGSNMTDCSDFSGGSMSQPRQDAKATGPDVCTLKVSPETAYGFEWASTSAADAKKAHYKSILYTPITDDFGMSNACQGLGSLLVITDTTKSQAGDFVSLNFGAATVKSLRNMLQGIKDEKVCVADDQGTWNIFWNQKFLFDELNKVYTPEINANKCVAGS